MTPQSILLGVGAGLISAIVFASATTGPALSRVLFFLLTPFPLYLAGLGLGLVPAIAAAATATLALLSVSSPLGAAMFAAEAAAPAVILTRLAMLNRAHGEDRVWYPIGRVVAVAALLAAGATAALLLAAGTDAAALTAKLKPMIVEFIKSQVPSGPDAPLTDEQISSVAEGLVPLLPAFLGMLLMLMALLSLWLAGRVTLASGRLSRPWPSLKDLELPSGSALMLLAATALSFAGGRIGLAATAFAGAFQLAFALQGLAVAHHLTTGSPWRGFILSALYAALIVLTPYALALLALAGLADTVFRYRHPRERLPPNT